MKVYVYAMNGYEYVVDFARNDVDCGKIGYAKSWLNYHMSEYRKVSGYPNNPCGFWEGTRRKS